MIENLPLCCRIGIVVVLIVSVVGSITLCSEWATKVLITRVRKKRQSP